MTFISPMLAASLPEKKKSTVTDTDYVLEVKHDGMRAVIAKTDSGIEVYSRTGKLYAEHLPRLVDQIDNLPVGTILDGELMVTANWLESENHFNSVPVPDFNKTMRIMGSKPAKAVAGQEDATVDFHAFDILWLSGDDLTDQTYSSRQDVLSSLSAVLSEMPDVYVTNALEEWGDSDTTWLVNNGIEGAIFKHRDSLYLPGKRRANTWYKMKIEQTADVVVMGFTEANEGKTGRWLGKIGAIVFGAYTDSGELVEVGQCSGMSDAERDRWTAIWQDGTGHGRVIEIKYNDLVGEGTPRHPQYRTERLDKNQEDCLLSQFTKG